MGTRDKVSVAIGVEELAWARAHASRVGSNLSALVTRALSDLRQRETERAQQNAAWAEYLTWATDGRGVSAAELAAARLELGLTETDRDLRRTAATRKRGPVRKKTRSSGASRKSA